MILSPLQLTDYWLDSISLRTNRDYEPDKPADLKVDHIHVDVDVQRMRSDEPEKNGTFWLVSLKIRQDVPEGKNIPYEFSLELAGVIAAHPSLNGERLEKQIEVNGPSMLFGIAREVVRAATGRGLYAPVILPSANFFQRLAPRDAALPSCEATTKKGSKSKAAPKKATKPPKKRP
jgi:preprotein translocase subunit SecB